MKKEAKKVQRQKGFFLLKYNMLLFSALSNKCDTHKCLMSVTPKNIR